MKQKLLVLLAAVCLFALAGCSSAAEYQPIAQPSYPALAPYPDEAAYVDERTGEFDSEGFFVVYDAWAEDLRAQWDQPEGYTHGLEGFFAQTIPQVLSGAEGENRVYSPLSLYLALGMLAELTDGESRQQVLDLLEAENLEDLRTQATALWNANYRDDGAVKSLLTSSLWLNEKISFLQPTLDTLAEVYYASSYQGEMGSPAFDQAFQDWLNRQTDGLLEEQAGQLGFSQETVLALASTLSFRAKWSSDFSPENTTQQVFHSPVGDLTCDFMHQSDSQYYYWGEGFAAVAQPLENNGRMWFILPDEGLSPEDLLAGDELFDFLEDGQDWEKGKYLTVNLSVPKFDVTSQMELSKTLADLGLTQVFDPQAADFSPMTGELEGEISLSQVQHDARVSIDEEGCTAVTYTVLGAAGATEPPEEEVDFVADRPFLFVLTGTEEVPLFTGVVNQPG